MGFINNYMTDAVYYRYMDTTFHDFVANEFFFISFLKIHYDLDLCPITQCGNGPNGNVMIVENETEIKMKHV